MRKNIQAFRDKEEVEILEQGQEFKKGLSVIEQSEVAKINREHAIKQAEKYLDGQTYDLTKITAEIDLLLKQTSQIFVHIGRRLIAVKKVEGHGSFTKWLEQNFPLSTRQAQYFMFVADRLEKCPELASFAKAGVSKAIALLELPEEYTEEYIQEGTINGKPLDEYQAMTKKELEAEIKKLKNNQEKIIAEETKALKAENNDLIRENKRLKAYEPTEKTTPEWCLEKTSEIMKSGLRVVNLVHELMADERLKDDIMTKAKIEGQVLVVKRAAEDLLYEMFPEKE